MAETLGPYLLDKRIGAGGMADVFLARGPRGICVVKRPHPHLCANPDFVRMFLDEAAILASLHHPNIAEIFDLGQVNGVFYLTMEYVPGFDLMTISLEHERQGELMAPELCARIVADVAGALHSAHEAKHPKTGQPLSLIHRDVSPHNILLSTSGVVKLIDFGVARAATATHRTQAGLVKGKYPYMAPEQITGQDIDRRVDIYALGLVLYELLTNVRAIAGNTEVEQIDNARSARIRPIEQLRPNLAMPIRQILASCVHPDRDGRYPTALALKEDLEKYLRYVGQPIGQEDLLRLFRVVAAEVAHLEPGTPPQLDAAAAQHTWGGARTERELPSDPGAAAEDVALGVAPTAPSMRMPRPELVAPTIDMPNAGASTTPADEKPTGPHAPIQARATGPQQPPDLNVTIPAPPGGFLTLPKEMQSTAVIGDRQKIKAEAEAENLAGRPPRSGIGKWLVLAVLAAAVGVLGAVLLGGSTTTSEPDAGAFALAPVVDAGPVVAEVDDAGAGPSPEPDAGSLPDDRAAVVEVSADLRLDISADGHSFGQTKPKGDPVRLELAPGKHLLQATNAALFCNVGVELDLAPGDNTALKLPVSLGKVQLKVVPAGQFYVAGKLVNSNLTAFKELTLCQGEYEVKVKFDKYVKSRPVRVSAGNTLVVDFGPIDAP